MSLQDLTIVFVTLLTLALSQGDVVVCGGFIKSSVKIPFSKVKVGVFSVDGVLKESTECAPHNGYFLLPLYSKGEVLIRVMPPAGWTFSPAELPLNIDGTTDSCSKGEDINFMFYGFTVSGRIVSKGLDVGPSGVTTTLTNDQGFQQHVSSVNGKFTMSQILSGTYTITFSHPSWKMEQPSSLIVVEMDNYEIEEAFVVVSYNAEGMVHSSGQPIAGVEIYLTPLTGDKTANVDGCESVQSQLGICKVVSDSSGHFKFPALAPGKYKVVPHYKSEHSTFDVSPNQLTFNVIKDTVILKESFTVNGFAVMGKILDSEGGNVLGGVSIFVNGDKVATTDVDGMFELSNVTSGEYEVEAKLKGYYFPTHVLSITPNSPVLPTIFANAYQLCGTVNMAAPPKSALPLGQRKVGLQPADEGANAAMVTTVTGNSGAFCFKVSPGLYTVQSLIGNSEYKDGLRIEPESIQVEVTNKPMHNTEFVQVFASVKGKVKCIKVPCDAVSVQLVGSDEVVHKVTVKGDTWSAKKLLPGSYQVSVDYPQWCWKEPKAAVTIEAKTDNDYIVFVQSGYIMKVQVSHAIQLNFSQANDENIGTFSLEPGTNRFCLKKPGVYELVPYTCHLFPQQVYTYDTNKPDELVLNAVKHLVTGEIYTLNTDTPIQVVLTNLDTHEKLVADTSTTGVINEEGYEKLTYSVWSAPLQKYIAKPVSDNLLFTPPSHTLHVSDTQCPTHVPVFHGRPGTFVSGKVSPSVRGVLVTLTCPEKPTLKHTQITDEKGEYSIGPLHYDLSYEVSAEKQNYQITRDGHDFTAVKLSKLTVTVMEGDAKLMEVLVSVSGTNGYRNNVILHDTSLVLSGLVPGQYFIRPIMKEYEFTPSSKMLTISEGQEVELELVAQRVAYSCYGKVTTLNGRPQPGIVVEGTGAGECALQEEGVTDAEGMYRIRGLPPSCPITISVRSDKSSVIRRASPSSKLVKGEHADSSHIDFIVFHEPTLFDVTGYVEINDEYLTTTKVLLVEDSSSGRIVHSSILDSSRLFVFPEMDLSSTYSIKLESSLSPSMYAYKTPEVKVKSEGTFQHIETKFNPTRKSVHQEQVTRASFTALAIIVLSMVLAANHATLVPVFTQVFQSVMNRNNNEVPTSGETNGMEYIDDIHRGIRRKAAKKR